MVKTRKIKVKSIENEEIIMAITMTKTIITKIIITIMMRMRMIIFVIFVIMFFVFVLWCQMTNKIYISTCRRCIDTTQAKVLT